MHNTQDKWIKAYREKGALWIHDGNTKCPHVRLTKGGHSGGFFNSRLITRDPVLLYRACEDLLMLHAQAGYSSNAIDRVVGPETGGAKIADSIKTAINYGRSEKRSQQLCLSSSTKKKTDGENEIMVWDAPQPHCARCNERVLLCDDVVSAGSGIELAAAAVSRAGRAVLPVVFVLVNRSGKDWIGGRRIISLINKPMPIWTPDECPLCKEGSKALCPADAENWKRLNADY